MKFGWQCCSLSEGLHNGTINILNSDNPISLCSVAEKLALLCDVLLKIMIIDFCVVKKAARCTDHSVSTQDPEKGRTPRWYNVDSLPWCKHPLLISRFKSHKDNFTLPWRDDDSPCCFVINWIFLKTWLLVIIQLFYNTAFVTTWGASYIGLMTSSVLAMRNVHVLLQHEI